MEEFIYIFYPSSIYHILTHQMYYDYHVYCNFPPIEMSVP